MKISAAVKDAFRVYGGHFGTTVKFLVAEACMTLAAFAPLLFLTDGNLQYLALLAVAAVIAVPIAVRLAVRLLEPYPYRISGYGWVFAAAVALATLIAFVSVLWQTLKAAQTNPATELKKE